MDGALALIAHHGLNQSVRHLRCTGGGAFKFESMFNIQAGIKLKICDEMDCTIKGLNFLLNFSVPDTQILTIHGMIQCAVYARGCLTVRLNGEANAVDCLGFIS